MLEAPSCSLRPSGGFSPCSPQAAARGSGPGFAALDLRWARRLSDGVGAIAKGEAEAVPVCIPMAKPARKQAAGYDQAAEVPKRRGKGGEEQTPAQVQQPRVGMG